MKKLMIVAMACVASACVDTRDDGGAPRPVLPTPATGTDADVPPGADAGIPGPGSTSTHVFPARDLRCADPFPPCATTVPVLDDQARTASMGRELGGSTFTYAIHVMSMPEATFDGRAVGFNLDGMDSGDGDDSGDCAAYAADHRSATETTHDGVDNALEGLVPTIESVLPPEDCPGMVTDGCLDAILQGNIAEGTDVMLLEVAGVDSFVNDDNVTVSLYAGRVAGVVAHDASGSLAAGQVFETVQVLATAEAGDIFQGRLRVRWPSIALSSGAVPLLPGGLVLAELRASLSATGFTNGALGGAATVDDLVAAGTAVDPTLADTLRSVFESMADISPSSDPFICQAVSTGFQLQGIEATRLP